MAEAKRGSAPPGSGQVEPGRTSGVITIPPESLVPTGVQDLVVGALRATLAASGTGLEVALSGVVSATDGEQLMDWLADVHLLAEAPLVKQVTVDLQGLATLPASVVGALIGWIKLGRKGGGRSYRIQFLVRADSPWQRTFGQSAFAEGADVLQIGSGG